MPVLLRSLSLSWPKGLDTPTTQAAMRFGPVGFPTLPFLLGLATTSAPTLKGCNAVQQIRTSEWNDNRPAGHLLMQRNISSFQIKCSSLLPLLSNQTSSTETTHLLAPAHLPLPLRAPRIRYRSVTCAAFATSRTLRKCGGSAAAGQC